MAQIGFQRSHGCPHQCREPFKPGPGRGQRMGLLIGDHLQPMFNLAQHPVMRGQTGRIIGIDPARRGQPGQPVTGAAHPQVRVTPACDQLPGLGEKLDLADPAAPQFQVVPGQGERAMQPLVVADPQPHVMRILDGGKIKVLAPDKRAQRIQKPLPRRDIARASPRLDIGRTFPGPAHAFIIAFGSGH